MRNTLLLLFLLAATAAFGQRSAEAGMFFGVSNYQGDFAKNPVSLNETGMSVGAVYQYFVDPKWGVKGSFTYGQISGKDSNLGGPPLRYRGWAFRAGIWELAGHVQYHPFGKARQDPAGRLQKSVSPFASLGLGMAYTARKLTVPFEDRALAAEPGARSIFLVMPISAGVRYVASENVTLTAELGQRATFSDYIDGVSKYGNSKARDWYMFFGIGVTYTLMAEY